MSDFLQPHALQFLSNAKLFFSNVTAINSEFIQPIVICVIKEGEVIGIMNVKIETRGCETFSIKMGPMTTCFHLAKNVRQSPY